MQRYKDLDRDSGVHGFEINDTSIKVYFKNTTRPYIYSYRSAGIDHVENMKRLALAGDGLNHYIQKYAKKLYE